MTSAAERPIAILSAPGSRGDVNPMVSIGRELHQRGFDVVISLAENYAEVAEANGLMTERLISEDEFNLMISDPNVWKPLSGARAVLRDAAGKFLEPHLSVIQKHHRPGKTILVAHPLDFASRIFRDHKTTTPLVSIQLSPAIVRNADHPPRLSPWRFEPRRPPWLVRTAYAMADYCIADRFLSPSVNVTRKRLGLKSVTRILDRWWLSPDLVLGLYPKWFGDSRPACQGEWQACGFPLQRHPDYQRTTAAHTNDDKPIFFTPGTAHQHAKEFFLNAVQACESIGKKCILATSQHQQLPTTLPVHAMAVGYVNLDEILRTCAAIVHHGGIGTTAMAFSTGCPQVVCPMAFDQFHNADRVEELGVGQSISQGVWNQSPANAKMLANTLSRVIGNPDTRRRSDEFAALEMDYQGAVVAANAIIDLFRRSARAD